MPLRALRHPAVRAWFEAEFAAPTSCQAQAWPRIRGGGHALIAAPTGSGKTLAAGIERAVAWAAGEVGLPAEGARQLVDYLELA